MSITTLLNEARLKFYQVKGRLVPSLETKRAAELSYWRKRSGEEGVLRNKHYQFFYTEFFGIDPQFYAGKRVLDVGCGPRGSLEWADMVAERVGLDPLAKSYLALGADQHQMRYVEAGAESIPFPDGHFDVVCSFNSLDHVEDLDRCIAEIVRILGPGGTLLLIAESHKRPTACEPVTFGMELVDRFGATCTPVSVRRLAMSEPGIYESAKRGVPYDPERHGDGDSLICARFERR